MAKSNDPGKPSKNNDEYQLPGDEGFHIEPPEKPPRKSLASRVLGNKRLLIAVGLVVAVFAVYLYLKATSNKDDVTVSDTDRIKPLAQQQPVQQQAILPSASTTPILTRDPMQDQVDQVAQQTRQNQQQISQLQNNMQQVQTTVIDVSKKLDTLNDSVATLGQAPAVCAPKAVKRTVVAKPVRHYPVYFVKALVPGRAWLEATNGYMTTVKVGDNLAGYGTVLVINPSKGAVGTSTGRLIRFKDS